MLLYKQSNGVQSQKMFIVHSRNPSPCRCTAPGQREGRREGRNCSCTYQSGTQSDPTCSINMTCSCTEAVKQQPARAAQANASHVLTSRRLWAQSWGLGASWWDMMQPG